jgi:hypothetical protein
LRFSLVSPPASTLYSLRHYEIPFQNEPVNVGFQTDRYSLAGVTSGQQCSSRVYTQWFLRGGRKAEPPKYLDAADRRQCREGDDAFLRAAGKLPARLGPQAAGSWRPLRRLTPVLVVAAMLTGCARGGIDLAAMMADDNCEQGGYQLGTPQYADCRMELAPGPTLAMQAYYQCQQNWFLAISLCAVKYSGNSYGDHHAVHDNRNPLHRDGNCGSRCGTACPVSTRNRS